MRPVAPLASVLCVALLAGCAGEREAPADARTRPAQDPAASVNPAPVAPPTSPGPSALPPLDEQGPPDEAMPPGPVNPTPEDPPRG